MRLLILAIAVVGLLAACAAPAAPPAQPASEPAGPQPLPEVTVYRSPTWGCCGDWMEYMEQNGFPVKAEDLNSPEAEQVLSQVPPALQGCHTAIVDGYIIEGHVPVKEINRLLAERPANVVGLAVPGMPVGSPGMEVAGQPAQPYDVLTFDKNGNAEVYASYGG